MLIAKRYVPILSHIHQMYLTSIPFGAVGKDRCNVCMHPTELIGKDLDALDSYKSMHIVKHINDRCHI